ncbi:neuroblast differentiation-associated protein AHNAK-like [Polyodon spathula]|uniref:neuroblast differentiation-associated protein AHNAK-like n=1 Tax=Polyodon spathula TaxID=7913 RepID=UPI001B7F468D|nr:neuroblast differentiation-associated protein AHNAK-like [Polyodon spathula]
MTLKQPKGFFRTGLCTGKTQHWNLGCDRELEESHLFIKDRESLVGEVKDTERSDRSERPASTIHPLHHPITREEPESPERVVQKEKLHAELKQVLNLKRSLQKQTSHSSLRSMDMPEEVNVTHEEEGKLSELVEVVVETEPEAGATGFSVFGGGNKGIFVKDVLRDSPAAKALSLREGDQLLSARVYFENVKYEDALKILQCAENYKVSYLLKRTVPGANISVSPSKDIKGPKAKMPKLSVKSITPMKKKKKKGKASVKLSGGTSLPAGAEFNVEGTPAKLELSPVDVEFAFPKFSKLKKSGKAATGGEIAFTDSEAQASAAIPWRKKRRIKFPRMRVKDAAQVDVSGETPRGSLTVTSSKGKVELDVPEAKLKTKEKSPKFGIFLPKTKKAKVDVSLPKVDVDIKTPEAKFKPPKVELDLNMPTVKADFTVPKPELEGKEDVKFKPPKLELDFGFPSGKAEVPEVEIKGLDKDEIKLPKVELDISLPIGKADIPKPEVSVKGPKVDIKGGIEAPEGKVKGEGFKIKMPKFGISSKTSDHEGPEVEGDLDVEGPEGKLKMPKVKLPKIGLSLPSGEFEGGTEVSAPRGEVDIEGPEGKHKGGLKMPSINIAAPKVDLDFSLSKGKDETDLKMPAAEGTAEAGMKGPGVEIKMPKVTLPKFGDSGATDYTEAKVSVPKVDVKGPKAEVKGGIMEVESPDVKFKGLKMKMPSFEISAPKMKGEGSVPETEILDTSAEGKMKLPKMPSIDISLPVPDLDLNFPLSKGTGPGAEMKGDADTRSRGSREQLDMKLKMPKISFPKFGLSGKGKESGADMHISTPKVEVKEPKIDMQGIEIEGPSAKGAKISKPKIDLSLPKIKSPEAKMDIQGMDIEGSGSKGGKITMPKIDLSVPKMKSPETELDVQGMDIEGSGIKGGKITVPKIDLSLPKIKFPEGDVSVPEGKIKVKGPKVEGDETDARLSMPFVKMPAIDIDMPKIDLDLSLSKTKTDVEGGEKVSEHPGAGGSFEGPDIHLKMPKISLPKFGIKGSEGDADADLDLKGQVKPPKVKAEIKGTDIGDAKVKGPGITMPSLEITFGKGKEAEIDVKAPKGKRDISIPELETGIKPTNAKTALEGPGFEAEGTDAKLKLPTVKMPSFDISVPKLPDVHFDIKMPKGKTEASVEGDISGQPPSAKAPDIEIKMPKLPTFEKGTGEVEIEAPEIDVEGPDGKLTGPKLKMPTFGISFPKGKSGEAGLEGELDVSSPTLKAPEVQVKAPKGKLEVTGPDVDIDMKGGKVKLPTVKLPSVDISSPKVDIGFGLPKAKGDDKEQIGLLKAERDMPSSGVSFDVPDVSLKMPKFSLPKFGDKAKAGAADLEVPKAEVKVTPPKIDVEIRAPSIESDADGKAKRKEGKMKMPRIKMPSFGISKREGEITVSGPEVDTKVKKGKVEIKAPEFELEDPEGKVKTQNKFPKFKMSSPKGKGLEAEAKLDTGFSGKGGFEAPDVTLKMPKISMPKFGTKGADIDLGVPHADLEGKEKIKMPALEISLPAVKQPDRGLLTKAEVDVSEADIKGYEGDLKIPKMPTIDISAPKIELDIGLSKAKAGAPLDSDASIKAEGDKGFEGPDFKLKMPKISLPTFGISGSTEKDIELETRGTKPDISKKAEIKTPELHISTPKATIDTPDYDIEDGEGKMKMPKIKMPKVDISLPKGKTGEADISLTEGKVRIEEPDFDGARESKFNLPSFGLPKFSSPTVKAPELDLEFNLGKPRYETEITGPHIKGLKIEGMGPPGDTEGEFKIKGPNIKMPKVQISDPVLKGADVEIDVGFPKAEKEKGNIEIKPPKIEGSIDISGKEIKGPKVKGTKFKIGMPKRKVEVDAGLEADMKKLDVDEEGAGGRFQIKMPKFGMSKGKVEVPELETSVAIEGGDSRFKMPQIALPDVGFSSSKEGDADARVGITLPKAELDLKKDIKVKGPKAEKKIKADAPELEGPEGHLKMPKFKIPSIEISVSKDQGEGEAEFTAKGNLEGKTKKHHFKMPGVEISAPKVKADEQDGEFGLVLPEDKEEIKLKMPKISMPSVGFSDSKDKEASVELITPEDDGKGEDFKIKMPKFGISSKTSDLEGPAVEIKGLDKDEIKLPKVELDISLPIEKADVPKPKVSVKGPKVDIKGGIEAPEGKVKGEGFKIKMPKFGISSKTSDHEGPEVEGDLDVEGPEGKLKMPKVKLPKIGLSLPSGEFEGGTEVSAPRGEVDIEGPEGKHKGGLKMPSINIAAPKVDLDFSLSKGKDETDLKMPAAEGTAEAGMKGPGVEIKMPKVTLPKFGGSGATGDADSLPKGVGVGGKVKVDIKDPKVDMKAPKVEIKAPEVEVGGPEWDTDKKSKVKIPKFGIELPKVTEPQADIEVSAPDAKVKVKGLEIKGKGSEVPSKSGETGGEYEGPKMPKVKKAVFVFDKPKTNSSSTSLSESEGSLGSAEAKIRMPKIKMKPTFGKSHPTTKGVKVKGEANGDEGEEVEGKSKSGKTKLPKVTFSPGKTGSFDVTLNGSGRRKGEGSGPHVNGESEPTFQNGSQEDKATFGKLKLPKIELSSPYTKGTKGDAEMSMKPVKTEETSGPDGEGKGMKFKSPKITFSGFKKKGKGEEEKSGALVSSTARTEMALLESGDKKTTESSSKPRVSIGFVSGRSKGEYTVESSASATCGESSGVHTLRAVQKVEEQKTEGKEKSPKFRLPKSSLSSRSKGILEISSEGSPQGSRDSLQQMGGAESSGGFKIQMPRLGFKTSQEVHTSEEQIVTVQEGGMAVGSKTLKHTMTERSTTI